MSFSGVGGVPLSPTDTSFCLPFAGHARASVLPCRGCLPWRLTWPDGLAVRITGGLLRLGPYCLPVVALRCGGMCPHPHTSSLPGVSSRPLSPGVWLSGPGVTGPGGAPHWRNDLDRSPLVCCAARRGDGGRDDTTAPQPCHPATRAHVRAPAILDAGAPSGGCSNSYALHRSRAPGTSEIL